MAEDTLQQYPFSTYDGRPIPYDIYRPLGLIIQSIADAVSAALNLPAAATVLVVYSTIDCILRFDGNASVSADGVHQSDAHFLPAEFVMVLDPNAAATLTVIGIEAAATGKLYINTAQKWSDIRKPALAQRS